MSAKMVPVVMLSPLMTVAPEVSRSANRTIPVNVTRAESITAPFADR